MPLSSLLYLAVSSILLVSYATAFMVNIYGTQGSFTRRAVNAARRKRTAVSMGKAVPNSKISPTLNNELERPVEPTLLLPNVEKRAQELADWCLARENILILTGAGLSTESGIPDYRGSNGAYHRNNYRPMIHDQFMSSHKQRQRYWGRGLVGWKSFAKRQPNEGHEALTRLYNEARHFGVTFSDSADYHHPNQESAYLFGSGQNQVSCITQNVDELHQKAHLPHVTELHGRTSSLECMNCGATRHRDDFSRELEQLNKDWLTEQQKRQQQDAKNQLRPDGDAQLVDADYSQIQVPPCTQCHDGFMKPQVVFFGDVVPKYRVERCKAAVEACDGLLCIGTSLAVHSAFRFVKLANSLDTSVCVLNVGETRAEAEGYDVVKIEAPIGPTLTQLVAELV